MANVSYVCSCLFRTEECNVHGIYCSLCPFYNEQEDEDNNEDDN